MAVVRIRVHHATLRESWRYRLSLVRRWHWICETCATRSWRSHRTQDGAKTGMIRHIDERHTP